VEQYLYKATIQQLATKLLCGLVINRDYVIAGGFVRDSLLDLEPKDIDVFIDNKVFPSEIDFEMFVSENGGRIKLTGTRDHYTSNNTITGNPAAEIILDAAPIVANTGDVLFDPRTRSFTYSFATTAPKQEEPVRDLQFGREIHRTYDVLYDSVLFTINFIFTTIDKGFTPENLVDTFDCNLVQAYIANDLSLVPHKTFEQSVRDKTAIIWVEGDDKDARKSKSRFISWSGRNRSTYSWTYNLKSRHITVPDKIRKYIAEGPYKSFINRNGKPSRDAQLKAYAPAMPVR
jgi:hypothetical protein